MKKTILLFLVMALLGTMCVAGLAWAQIQPKEQLPTPLKPPPPPLSPPSKIVFVTSKLYSGNLGGLAGADQKCQQLANDAGLSGIYKAWLNDGYANPNSTFRKNPGPYRLRSGAVIARSWVELVNGPILLDIVQDERGNHLFTAFPTTDLTGMPGTYIMTRDGTSKVWTGLIQDGTIRFNENYSPAQTCVGWTYGGMFSIPMPGYTYTPPNYKGLYTAVAFPSTEFSKTHWSGSGGADPCNLKYRLYCFEQ